MLNKSIDLIEEKDAFANATKTVKQYKKEHPSNKVLSLGIGDVSRPLVKPVIDAMHEAVDEMADMKTFRGYGLYYGLEELKEAILKNEYRKYGISVDEIYVSNGTKTDSTSILELFDIDSKILLSNPMYPIYRNGAYSLNRKVSFAKLDRNFKMLMPKERYDIIYICSPSNPIGIAYNREDLTKWVKYALKHHSVIIYDNVYNAYVRSKDIPKSIYEIEGAKGCAIELRSFSKSASFTGLRCSYFVLPEAIEKGINHLWQKRTINRFNGADYIVQKGAIATFSKEAKKELKDNIRYYQKNADYIKRELTSLGLEVIGGNDAPYLWVSFSKKKTSWEIFKTFLNELEVVVVPGEIFGSEGKHYCRVSALGTKENTVEAIERIKKYYEK